MDPRGLGASQALDKTSAGLGPAAFFVSLWRDPGGLGVRRLSGLQSIRRAIRRSHRLRARGGTATGSTGWCVWDEEAENGCLRATRAPEDGQTMCSRRARRERRRGEEGRGGELPEEPGEEDSGTAAPGPRLHGRDFGLAGGRLSAQSLKGHTAH